jgi:hypothetical protein
MDTGDAFELDSSTGQFFAVKPLDREQKSIHFVVVNISIVAGGGGLEIMPSSSHKRPKRQPTRTSPSSSSAPTFNAVLERKSTISIIESIY